MSTTFSQEMIHSIKSKESGISLSEQFQLAVIRYVSLKTISSNTELHQSIDRISKRLAQIENIPFPTVEYQSILPRWINTSTKLMIAGTSMGVSVITSGFVLSFNEYLSSLYESDSLLLELANWTEPTMIPIHLMALSIPFLVAPLSAYAIFKEENNKMILLRGKQTNIFHRVFKKLLLTKRGRVSLSYNESVQTKLSLEVEEYHQKIMKEKSKIAKDLKIVNQYMNCGVLEISQGDLQVMHVKSINA